MAAVLVVNRFLVPDVSDVSSGSDEGAFAERARVALAALAARPGYRSGRFGRAADDPRYWCLVTEWASVGAYRRALGAFEVKVDATPLLAESVDEPSAYEVLLSAEPGGEVVARDSDRAATGDAPITSTS